MFRYSRVSQGVWQLILLKFYMGKLIEVLIANTKSGFGIYCGAVGQIRAGKCDRHVITGFASSSPMGNG